MVINFNTWWFPIDFNLTRIVSRAISTAALVVTLFPCNAAGGDWVLMMSFLNPRVEIAMSSVNQDGGLTRSWLRETYSDPQAGTSSIGAYVSKLESWTVDCRARAYRITSLVYRNREEKVVGQISFSPND